MILVVYWWLIGGIIGGNLVFLSDVFVILQNVFETNMTVIGLVPYHLESYYWPPTFSGFFHITNPSAASGQRGGRCVGAAAGQFEGRLS